MQLFLLLCNTRSSNSAAMCCSHRKLSETGLRIVGTFLKVQLCVGARRSTCLRYFDPRRYPDNSHNLCATISRRLLEPLVPKITRRQEWLTTRIKTRTSTPAIKPHSRRSINSREASIALIFFASESDCESALRRQPADQKVTCRFSLFQQAITK